MSHVVPELNPPDVALVVADDALRSALKMLLTVFGLRVTEYRTIAAFLISAAAMPQCLVVDCQLPETPRRLLCEEILELDERIPVVLVTTYFEEFDALRAEHPNIYVVRKPFVGNHLVRTVGDALHTAFGTGLPGVSESSA